MKTVFLILTLITTLLSCKSARHNEFNRHKSLYPYEWRQPITYKRIGHNGSVYTKRTVQFTYTDTTIATRAITYHGSWKSTGQFSTENEQIYVSTDAIFIDGDGWRKFYRK